MLFREKWDVSHYADGRTYGEGTVERAIRETNKVYVPEGNDREDSTATEVSESVATPSIAGEESTDPVRLAVLDRDKTAVVALSGELKALKAQHEYLMVATSELFTSAFAVTSTRVGT